MFFFSKILQNKKIQKGKYVQKKSNFTFIEKAQQNQIMNVHTTPILLCDYPNRNICISHISKSFILYILKHSRNERDMMILHYISNIIYSYFLC